MKKLSSLVIMLFVAVVTAVAQGMGPIPFNAEVRRGQLDNGLTYYILKNQYPEHRASFWIAQRVGSIQEEDSQRGLAHFLEHMAFNGSENFKSSDAIVEFCRSIGCSFGGELNAYTSTDETVYRVCNVPTERTAVTDSVMLILKDWANGLSLDDAEIDKERGVIHEEWRTRLSATQRIFERNLPALYPGSKYGYRMPIGIMEVIDNFKPQVLRDYYKKWYRPDNQAIVVVGDIDIDRTENKIKELFGKIAKPAADAAKVVEEAVPDNEEMIVAVDKDKELRQDIVLVCFKAKPLPRELREDVLSEMVGIISGSICAMVNERFAEAVKDPNCPFVAASLEYGSYLMSNTMEAFELDVLPKDGKVVEATQAAYRELLRACKAGFNASEFQRAKDNIIAQVEARKLNKSKTPNDNLGPQLYNHFLHGNACPHIDMEYELDKQICAQIPVEAINETAKQIVEEGGKNTVILSLNRDKEGVVVPEAAAMKAALLAVNGETFEAYVDNAKNEPLVPQLPAKGSIVKETKNDKYGYTELTLSNGARVIMKKTDYKADQIIFNANSVGGKSLYGKEDIINFKLINNAIEASGLGNFNNTELSKALAGKKVSLSFNLGNQHETLSGSSTPKDIETLMQLNYLYFTNICKDQKSYDNVIVQYETQLKNIATNPDVAFSDSVQNTLNDHNPRFQRVTIDELNKVSYDRCLQIAKERLANAGDFTFYFVGNYDEAQLRDLICQYIASLPSTNQKETAKPLSTRHQGVKENVFKRKMETPKSNAYYFWYDEKTPYSVKNSVLAEAAGEVLQMIYLREIREKESAAYSAGAGGNCILSLDKPYNYIVGVCPFKPEKKDRALQIMEDELKNLAKTVDADMLNKVKENMLKVLDESMKSNGYWASVIETYDEYKVDVLGEKEAAIKSMTPQDVANFVKNVIIKGGNMVKVVMLPEE
ncbi:MAG: insulinase family protein [Bacteroidaceae bacterium]|nr:insulinase family protein [Bacteroidaceae bacterium]